MKTFTEPFFRRVLATMPVRPAKPRTCRACGISKPPTDFDHKSPKRLLPDCRECLRRVEIKRAKNRAAVRRWRANHPLDHKPYVHPTK